MQCQVLSERGFIRCEFWERCQASGVCLCELEMRESNGIPMPTLPSKVMTWASRREQILGFVEERGDVSVDFLMEMYGSRYNTACHWIRRLRDEGLLKKTSRTIGSGSNLKRATYALVTILQH